MARSIIPLLIFVATAATAGTTQVGSWHHSIEGNGTAFDDRWVTAEPLPDASSQFTVNMHAVINDDGHLAIRNGGNTGGWAIDGKACSDDEWRIAIDQQEFEIARTNGSTTGKATFLTFVDPDAFWKAFKTGSRMGVQFTRSGKCISSERKNASSVYTLVYSLRGSAAALKFIAGK
jgi:hypothetical protein